MFSIYFHAEKQEGGGKEGYHNPIFHQMGLHQFMTCLSSLAVLLFISVFLCITITITVSKTPNYESLNHVAC